MKLTLFALLSLPISVLAEGGLPNQPYIYVIGSAEIKKPADMLNIRFEVVSRAADQAKANQEVQAKAAKIFALLNDRKVAQNDVIAFGVTSQPQFEQEENGQHRGKIIGYTVSRSFELKIREATAFPKIVDELISIEGVELSGIDVGFSKEDEMQDDLWDKALKNARERAEKTLKPIGMKIDSVFAVSPVPFAQIYTKIFSETEKYVVTGSAAPSPEYRLGLVSFNQSAHVIYLISPAK